MTPEDYILKWWKKKTVRMLCEKTELKDCQVRKILEKHGITPISQKDLSISFILDHHEQLTTEEIADKLGTGYTYVSQICSDLGIQCVRKNAVKPAEKPRLSFWDRIKANGLSEEVRERLKRAVDKPIDDTDF